MKKKASKIKAVSRNPTSKKKVAKPLTKSRKRASEKSPAQKVEAACVAANIMGCHGGWVPKDADFVKVETKIKLFINEETGEIYVGGEEEEVIDTSKRDRLLEILRPLNLDDGKQSFMLKQAKYAIERFYLAKEKQNIDTDRKRNSEIEKLERLAGAAREFSQAWDSLGHNLQRSLACHMEGRFPTSKTRANGQTIMALVERTKRIERVATDDAWSLIAGAAELVEALKDDRSHDAAGYACVVAIGRAWMDCSGRTPGETHETTSRRTPFQRFMDEALAPMKIGDGVIYKAIQSLKIGEKAD